MQLSKPQREADSIVMHTVFAVVRRGIVCSCPGCSQQARGMLQWYIGPDLNPSLEQELYGMLRAHIERWAAIDG